jgi:hypothetical protein
MSVSARPILPFPSSNGFALDRSRFHDFFRQYFNLGLESEIETEVSQLPQKFALEQATFSQ